MLRKRMVLTSVALMSVLLVAGCPGRHATRPGSPAVDAVESFVDAMMLDDEAAQAAAISPAWLVEQGIDLVEDDYLINGYHPTGYVVTGAKGELVTVELLFEDGGAHRLTFRVRNENGREYVVPGSYDEDDWGEPGWIHPWFEAVENIR
ncbi:MAG: hypothetical protein R6X14_01000 [bacterium]